ncbi:hypothetical protein PR202_gb16504 [Eleusine coracana subsp. coracana]|uniref:Protein kinase domain-containing protein n=1 Tax=Eleusine coracana subsp. coracana TaxID=191504 RepID=A0AAV5F0N3_ELECO|nr:hypothetical protein PR202_gb16504 [Eleusine coracana subsp. coracana]
MSVTWSQGEKRSKYVDDAGASRGCAYAPFIMFIIEKVTKKTFKKECEHKSLRPNVPSGATSGASTPRQALSSEPNSPPVPSARSTPGPSHRCRGRGSSKKRGGLFKMLRGLFSICNRLDARLDNIEKCQDVLNKRQKAIYDHLAVQPLRSPSPDPAPCPPPVENPWSTFTNEESQYFRYYPSYAHPTVTAALPDTNSHFSSTGGESRRGEGTYSAFFIWSKCEQSRAVYLAAYQSFLRFQRGDKAGNEYNQGDPVAIKILDKEKVLKHKMVEQVMGSKTKIYIVLEYVTGGELFDIIFSVFLVIKVNHGRMREDEARRYFQQLINAVDYCHSRGVYHRDLKVCSISLSAVLDDGLLHTTCGTPNYVAPEVLEDQGYDGAMADLWSCGVILFVLLAGYLPFEDSNLMTLYKKISNAEFTFPPWTSFPAKRLLTRILDPNPMTRITIPEILEDEWFKKGYKRPEFDEKYDTTLDDVDAVFNDSEVRYIPSVI